MTILNLMKIAKSSPNGLKTLWEKEKLLVTSNFSFSYSVFKRLVLQTHKNQGLFGKGLTISKTQRNTKGERKRRNCSLQAISPIPTVFSKDLYCRHVKSGLVLERINGRKVIYNVSFIEKPLKLNGFS